MTETGAKAFNDAEVVSMAVNPLSPGAQTEAEIEPFRPKLWRHVKAGDELKVQEGAKLVGLATVLSIDES